MHICFTTFAKGVDNTHLDSQGILDGFTNSLELDALPARRSIFQEKSRTTWELKCVNRSMPTILFLIPRAFKTDTNLGIMVVQPTHVGEFMGIELVQSREQI